MRSLGGAPYSGSLGLGWDFHRSTLSLQMPNCYLKTPHSAEAIDLAAWKMELERVRQFAWQDGGDQPATRPTRCSRSSHRR